MKSSRRALLSGMLLLAACREEGNQSSLEAARADSSAAGYSVGTGTGTPGPARDSARPAPVVPTRPESTVAATRRDSTPRTAPPRRDSTRTTVATRDTTKRTPPRDTAKHTTHTATQTATTQPAPSGPVRVNDFLTYDAKEHTASVQLIAGYNGLNGSLNYNGATRGARVLVVPLGWRVHVTVTNRDTDLQHSAIVVPEVLPPPLELTTPAFTGAALPRLDEGLHDDEMGTLDFVADKAGRYMLACGVPGHAQSGMWLRIAVSPGVAVPAYR